MTLTYGLFFVETGLCTPITDDQTARCRLSHAVNAKRTAIGPYVEFRFDFEAMWTHYAATSASAQTPPQLTGKSPSSS